MASSARHSNLFNYYAQDFRLKRLDTISLCREALVQSYQRIFRCCEFRPPALLNYFSYPVGKCSTLMNASPKRISGLNRYNSVLAVIECLSVVVDTLPGWTFHVKLTVSYFAEQA